MSHSPSPTTDMLSSPSSEVLSLQALVRLQQEQLDLQQQTIQAQQQTIQAQQQSIDEFERSLKVAQERIEQLDAELKSTQKLNSKPKLRASKLNTPKSKRDAPSGKRPGSSKRSKKKGFGLYKERIIQPEEIPATAEFNGYRDYDVQELQLECYTIRFRLAEYLLEDGTTVSGQLPPEYRQGHFGPFLVGYILYQHYQCRTPQPLIYEQLHEWGVEISTGQLHNILSENKQSFHLEQQRVLEVGLATASYIHTDDTGARHQGKNGYCTVIGNHLFSYFRSTHSKSRVSFLETLHGGSPSYVLNDYAKAYLLSYDLAAKHFDKLSFTAEVLANDSQQWGEHLSSLGIVTVKAVRLVSEAALLGGLIESGVDVNLQLLSDGAPQFNVLVHALCWVHAERALRRLQGNTAQQRQNIEQMQQLLWEYYQDLRNYPLNPTAQEKQRLSEGFDQLFGRCFIKHGLLNDVLRHFRVHKDELLRNLESPDVPLHNNEAESDIREFVTRRKVSGGTRSDAGRQARDTFVGLKKTCRKLGISFWHFLISRLRGDGQIPPLTDVLRKLAANPQQITCPT